MTVLPTNRPARLVRATAALFDAIDEALVAGLTTPCRLSSAYDADDLDATDAAELIDACRNECPVLLPCSRRAALMPADAKRGTVMAGTYYPAAVKTPQWRELYDDLRDLIETGHYAPGDRLPTIDELAQDTQLHRTVIHVALNNLERDGLIIVDGSERRLVVSFGSIVGSRHLDLPGAAADIDIDTEAVAAYEGRQEVA